MTRYRFGGRGDPNDHFCLKDGLAGNWLEQNPPGCLKRQYHGANGTISQWHSPEWITHILQTGFTYDHFRESIEITLHNQMHSNIGGDIGDLNFPYSLNE